MTSVSHKSAHIHITGIVQGVGFRPCVYNLAVKHQLTGWVCNTASGVEIEVSGSRQDLDMFIHDLQSSPPPLAQIDHFNAKPIKAVHFDDFIIIHSQDQPGDFIPVSPDIAICKDCRQELFDPKDRRYHYPFINCTNCGPRFTIIQDIPYDRPNTSMQSFKLCLDCKHEYEDPKDRRFHAQPIACPDCGPQVWFEVNGQRLAKHNKAVQMARNWLKAGKILAIKGLGGFHLSCDAANPQAVNKLRLRKQRTDKPFALMAFDLKAISQYCNLTDAASKLLQSPQAPIVLLPIKRYGIPIANNTAPHQKRLGFMLPYTPLHLLLLEPEQDYPRILVMTSANISEEPIAYRNDEARLRLNKLADGFLMHDRPIYMRTDDSVFAQLDLKPYPIRRARGFAPNPIRVVQDLPNILGAGPHLKNTFCLSRDHYAFLSHYIGDLENSETLQAYENAIMHYEKLFRIKPKIIAYDMHPDYLATRYAKKRAEEEGIPLIPVQHHHAHIAACLADNKWESSNPVIGLSFDGTGYGTDGHIWGGEVLIAGYNDFNRRYHLAEVPMPGGDRAVMKPARMALSYLITSNIALEPDLPPIKSLTEMEIDVIKHQIQNHINTPLTSSMGRLFDAVAALLGIRQEVNYEAQAAIELEAIADPYEKDYYILDIDGHTIHTQALFEAIVIDMQNKVSINKISAKFHQSIIKMVLDICNIIRKETGIQHVALSGGVWQNLYLMSHTIPALENAQFIPLVHHQTPPNDSCVALGQVMVAAHQVNH